MDGDGCLCCVADNDDDEDELGSQLEGKYDEEIAEKELADWPVHGDKIEVEDDCVDIEYEDEDNDVDVASENEDDDMDVKSENEDSNKDKYLGSPKRTLEPSDDDDAEPVKTRRTLPGFRTRSCQFSTLRRTTPAMPYALTAMEESQRPISLGAYLFFCRSELSAVLNSLVQHIPRAPRRSWEGKSWILVIFFCPKWDHRWTDWGS
ncbi:hypothetical protein QBC33DRAFT_255747 [Phialemonium atrogriseum]|uniref:Uncharacterized protein n=1 Tax=Phialemonium atrogriseum TaxID=1093897 RepID=A0AAJ0BQX2_9PEZI|nr:uncharacterized protein QBC33DRAFT_255747 [Phialemonium atrogriseum]KAK1762833.1 hypothetical protein QBC33DRAFT_255747 [Phialemonium atrogriseum]